MLDFPTTDVRLIAALSDRRRHEEWAEFCEIYGPAILAWLSRRGIGRDEAQDVCQQVWINVLRGVERFEDDGAPASFRRWLMRLARNAAIDCCRERAKRPATCEQSGVWLQLCQDAEDDPLGWEQQYRTAVFRRAADIARKEVSEKHWRAFWQTAVEGRPTPAVAKSLAMSVGAVYVAKGRVLKLISGYVRRWEDEV